MGPSIVIRLQLLPLDALVTQREDSLAHFYFLYQGDTDTAYVLPSIAAALNTYTYIVYPGISFNGATLYDVSPTACAIECENNYGCNAYFEMNDTLTYSCYLFTKPFTSISLYSTGYGYRVKQPARNYTTLTQISFTGSIYYTFIGNFTECTAACDAFMSYCTGYTYSITTANSCNMMTKMTTANYFVSAGYNSVIFNATDASNVRKQVSVDNENLASPIATPTIITPTPAASPISTYVTIKC